VQSGAAVCAGCDAGFHWTNTFSVPNMTFGPGPRPAHSPLAARHSPRVAHCTRARCEPR
jgi:hypothetical protein